jgi:hypothetical protein
MRRLASLIAIAAFGLAVTQPLLAEAKQQDKGKGQSGRANAADVLLEATITAVEATIIQQYIAANGVAAFGPPEGLPPGIAKNLARGKPLPPGIAKRYLPQNLLTQLPRPGYEWLVVDNDILLVLAATDIIVDVLSDAF